MELQHTRVVEPFAVRDTVVSRLSHIEKSAEQMRFTFVCDEEIDGKKVGVVVLRIVMGRANVIRAAREALLMALGIRRFIAPKSAAPILH